MKRPIAAWPATGPCSRSGCDRAISRRASALHRGPSAGRRSADAGPADRRPPPRCRRHHRARRARAEWMKLMPREKSSASDPGSANGSERLLQLLENQSPGARRPISKPRRSCAPPSSASWTAGMSWLRACASPARPCGPSIFYSDNVTVRGLETIRAFIRMALPWTPAATCASQIVHIDTGDDGIVIKAGKDATDCASTARMQNISITNCTVHHAHGALIDWETSGWVRNLGGQQRDLRGNSNRRAYQEQPRRGRRRERAIR